MKRLMAAILLSVCLSAASVCAETGALSSTGPFAEESAKQHDARMKWWREARFGMFIHWGLSSVLAGTYKGTPIDWYAEWIMANAGIPVAEYARYAGRFNPVKFNARQWVLTARKAGMKYIVFTAKHHEGFAMFHSRASRFNIFDRTSFWRDPLKELADACHRAGIKLGVYYSQAQDWHHPGGATWSGTWDEAQIGSMDDYLEKVAVPQVQEILSNYGKVSVLWWDTPVGMTTERAEKLLPLLQLQPKIITNDRLGGGIAGDFGTYEQHVPSTGIEGFDWEACMTMNDTWGYKAADQNWKSTTTLIRHLIDTASKGGNYLLNVGPTSKGEIPAASITRLKEIGEWMKVNNESIYGTSASPFAELPFDGRCTKRTGKLYFHLFEWPENKELRVPQIGGIEKAYLLMDPSASLPIQADATGETIILPDITPDPHATVIVVEVS